jgi:hypothetical protein
MFLVTREEKDQEGERDIQEVVVLPVLAAA